MSSGKVLPANGREDDALGVTRIASAAPTLWQHLADLDHAESKMRTKHNALEQELDEAQSLLACSPSADFFVIEDLGAIVSETNADSMNDAQPSPALDETSEIELTAEQMDAMLEGRWQP